MSEVLRNKFVATGLTIAALVGAALAPENVSAEKVDSAAIGQISLGLGGAEVVDTAAAIKERREACTKAAIQPPERFYISRKGLRGIDLFSEGDSPDEVQTSILPSATAMYKPVKVNGHICDPSLVERVTSGTLFVGKTKVPKKVYFDLWGSNGNKAVDNMISLPNSNKDVIKACRHAESQKGAKKDKVRLILASVAMADTNGKIEKTDPYNLVTASWTVKCQKPRSIKLSKIKSNKNY